MYLAVLSAHNQTLDIEGKRIQVDRTTDNTMNGNKNLKNSSSDLSDTDMPSSQEHIDTSRYQTVDNKMDKNNLRSAHIQNS